MKRAPFVLAAVVPAAILLGLYFAEREERRGKVGRVAASRPLVAENPDEERGPARAAVDFGAARSRDLFKEDPAEAIVSGEPVRYQRNLFAARTAEGLGGGSLAATDLVWLANARPDDRASVERLVAIDTRLAGDDAGDAVRAAFGRTTGVRAREAKVTGGERLAELKALALKGGVHAVFVDPETPGDRVDVETEELEIEFADGRPVSVFAPGFVKVTRPERGDAEAAGDGLRAKFARRADGETTLAELVIERRVAIDLFDPEAARLKGPPVSIQAQGPLTWTPAPPTPGAAATRRSAFGSGVVEIGGGLAGTRGALNFKAGRGRVVFAESGGRPARFEAEDDVAAEDPAYSVQAGSLAIEPRRAGRAVFRPGKDGPVRVVLRAAHLPGDLVGDTTVTAAGAITIEPSSERFGAATEIMRVHASTKVVAEAPGARLTAGDATLFLGVLGGRRVPLKTTLARGVDGATDEADVKADELVFEREYDAAGEPRQETLVLKKDYVVRYRGRSALAGRLDARGAFGGATRPTSRPELAAAFGLLRTADTLVAAGAERFEAIRGLEPDAPSLLSVKGRTEFRLETRDGKGVAARLLCGRASLVLQPTRDEATGARGRRIESFSAEVGVTAETPGLFRATGEILRLRPEEEEVVLQGGARPARVVVRGRKDVAEDVEESFDAGRFIWSAPLLKLIAEAGMVADVRAAALPWLIDAKDPEDAPGAANASPAAKTVKTTIEAGRASVLFAPDGDGRAPREPREIDARDGVTLKQPGRRLTGKTAQFDLALRAGALAGTPLVYAIARPDAGERLEDRVEAPRASIAGGALLVEGPLTAKLHFARGLNALRFGDPTEEPTARRASPTTPLTVRAKDGGSFTAGYARLDGGVAAEQGRPERDGFSAAARTAEFFLAPDSRGKLDLALAVLRDDARFESPRLRAACDVMQFERAERRLKLYNGRPEPVRLAADGVARGVIGEATSLQVTFGDGRMVVEQTDVSVSLKPPPPPRPGDAR